MDRAVERKPETEPVRAARGENHDLEADRPHPDGIFIDIQKDLFAGLRREPKQAPAAGTLAFGSDEHQTFGNDGLRAAGHSQPYRPAAPEPGKDGDEESGTAFELTHGDLAMLSGDYFDPRARDERGEPVPDSLFALAKNPSSRPGQMLGTQDEVIYAIRHANPRDPRFARGGAWASLKFSEAVMKAVNERYLRLASANREHFANPAGPGSGGARSKNRSSAGGSYRALHEEALRAAHEARRSGATIDEAMAREAAASHFLQDSFASGHVRTPRASIAEYWNAKYPLFFEQFKKSVAQAVAIYMNAHETNLPTVFGSVLRIMDDVLSEVDLKTSGMPRIGFDTLAGLVSHDFDNEEGLWVVNALGERWQTLGDGHGGVRGKAAAEEADTRKHVTQAVELGARDVQSAYAADPELDEQGLFLAVRSSTPAPARAGDAAYGPEQKMPVLDSARDNGTLGWRQPDFRSLWTAKVRSDRDATFGSRITESMKSGDLHAQLSGLAAMFPPTRQSYGATLHPQRAYKEGFMLPMFANPFERIQAILDYNPGRGQSGVRSDNATMKDLERLDRLGAEEHRGKPGLETTAMHGLTLQQRVEYVRNLEGGSVHEDERRRIYELFATAPPGERKLLYRLLEGHAWIGMIRLDDRLHRTLRHDRTADALTALINQP